MTKIPVTVQRGVELLDREMPGWDEKIDLDTLNLASSCGCILGQQPRKGTSRTGRYLRNIVALGIEHNPEHYGFVVYGRGTWGGLTAAWRRVIEARRAA